MVSVTGRSATSCMDSLPQIQFGPDHIGFATTSSGGDHSTLIPANLTTLPHFSVSAAMNVPNSAGELGNSSLPMLVSLAANSGLANVAFISLLSRSITPDGGP